MNEASLVHHASSTSEGFIVRGWKALGKFHFKATYLRIIFAAAATGYM